jgi:excisionase family DNA binding protein
MCIEFSGRLKQTDKIMLKIGPAAKLLGVSKDTLRRWEASGKITSKRTRKGYRVYDPEQLKTLIKPEPKGLKIGEAAKTLGVSIDTLRRWAKKGKLPRVVVPIPPLETARTPVTSALAKLTAEEESKPLELLCTIPVPKPLIVN